MNEVLIILAAYGGLILFAIGFAEQSGLPFPGAPFLVGAGALAASGTFSVLSAVGWSSFGCMAADILWFYLGERGKLRILRVFPHLVSVQSRLYHATLSGSILHGVRMLVAAKFLPLGNMIPMHAGAMEVGMVRFLLVDGLSALFYSALYVGLGFAFHDQLEQVLLTLQKLGGISLILVLGAAGLFLIVRSSRSRGSPMGPVQPTGESQVTGENSNSQQT